MYMHQYSLRECDVDVPKADKSTFRKDVHDEASSHARGAASNDDHFVPEVVHSREDRLLFDDVEGGIAGTPVATFVQHQQNL